MAQRMRDRRAASVT